VRRANLLSVIGEEGGRQGCWSGSRARQKATRCHSNDGPVVQYRAVTQRIWHGLGSNPELLLMDRVRKFCERRSDRCQATLNPVWK